MHMRMERKRDGKEEKETECEKYMEREFVFMRKRNTEKRKINTNSN